MECAVGNEGDDESRGAVIDNVVVSACDGKMLNRTVGGR